MNKRTYKNKSKSKEKNEIVEKKKREKEGRAEYEEWSLSNDKEKWMENECRRNTVDKIKQREE